MTLVYVMIEIFQEIKFIFLFLFDDWCHLYYLFKIVFHIVQLRIPLISSLRNSHLHHAVFNFENGMHCPYISRNSFSKNINYVIHLILKKGINNIFPSQTSFLLLSSNTHASFANKPNKFCLRKPGT